MHEAPDPKHNARLLEWRLPLKPSLRRKNEPAKTTWIASLAAVGLLLLSGLVWLGTDLDVDGMSARDEFAAGSNPARQDSDYDGLGDGFESERGLSPVDWDTDTDRLPDRWEFIRGLDAADEDTDADGLGDYVEYQSTLDPTVPDMDSDGLLDGAELQQGTNILNPDTDGDGVQDANETGSSFSPLDPDTFNIGLLDSVAWAFNERGQKPSPDDDSDGIPDAWEGDQGAIDWGEFDPRPNVTDVLVEFVRVSGPDTQWFDDRSFRDAYEQVAQAFEQGAGIKFQWLETPVHVGQESRPHIIPSYFVPYYEDVLSKSRYGANPYVTTVVLNPQHDQSEVVHLGVAPIRGMLAAVDYGFHTLLYFEGKYTTYEPSCKCNVTHTAEVRLSPFIESAIEGGQSDIIAGLGFEDGGVLPNGDYFLGVGPHRVAWDPFWFRGNPRIIWSDGDVTPLRTVDEEIFLDDMAFTIFHEMGHTLGLCHLELEECFPKIDAEDRFRLQESAMYSGSDKTLRFLASEWRLVGEYITCPPQEPVTLAATEAAPAEIRHSKYAYLEEDILDIGSRTCNDAAPVPARTVATSYQNLTRVLEYERTADESRAPLAQNSATFSLAYLWVALGGTGAGGMVAVWIRRSRLG